MHHLFLLALVAAVANAGFRVQNGLEFKRWREVPHKFVVLLFNSKNGMTCTGSLVTPNTVFTAGHCGCGKTIPEFVSPVSLPVCALPQVYFETLSIHRQFGQAPHVPIKGFFIGPAYQPFCSLDQGGVGGGDVAVGKMVGPVDMRRVDTALAVLQYDYVPQPGETLAVIGYGLATEQDKRSSGILRAGGEEVVACTGPYVAQQAICSRARMQKIMSGDSGSPCIMFNGKQAMVLGVLSGTNTVELITRSPSGKAMKTVYEFSVWASLRANKNFFPKYMN